MASMGYSLTMGNKPGKLKETGIYRFTRNPQLILYNFLLIGFALLWPSWYSIPWIIIYYILAHMMVKSEEEHLSRLFDTSYEDYCKRVPRYF
jgi:protein-S-isoprenylcysteine O-methyltransferase Ste14